MLGRAWVRLAVGATLACTVCAGLTAERARALSEKAVLSAPVRHVRAGGVDFAYRSIGSGPPLVLLAGLESRMSTEWDPAVLAPLGARHRLMLSDYRGVGLSRGDVSHMTVSQLADDTSRFMRALRLGRPDVWGQSMGGYVAQELVIRHPAQVHRLVLTSSSPGSGHWVPPSVPLPAPGDSAGVDRITFTPDAAGRAAAAAFNRRVGRWRPQETLSSAADTAEFSAVVHFLAFPREGAWEALPRVRAHVLVAGGRRDVVAPPANARFLAGRLHHATLRLYPSGHNFFIQDRSRFVPDLERFLDRSG